MSKSRVLFITPLPPPVHGSAMVSQYIKDSLLIGNSFDCDFVNLSTSRSIDEIGKKTLMKYIRFIGAYLIVLWKLMTHRYALCYLAITCYGLGFLKDAPFVLLCKLFSRKVVIHQHNKGMSKYVDKKPYNWLLPLVYKNTKIILLSWHLYEDISKMVKREQILICPNGIPEIAEAKNNAEERENSVPRLLFLSNLIESKGIYILLDACKILKEKGYKFICDFVGGETTEINRAVFESAVKEKGLDEYVVYLGPKYGNEKERYWNAADVFVQPTYEDCFPLTIVEAMQHGKSVVSTDEGAIPDLVVDGMNGFVCERRNVDSLANALEILLVDKDLRVKMGVEGYNQYKSKFTLRVFEQNMNDVFNEILKN